MKKIKIILLIIITTINSFGQTFEENIIVNEYDNVKSTKSIVLIDLDLDNDLDLVFISVDDGKVGWYENDGNGNYGDQILLSFFRNDTEKPESIVVGDIDNDGDLDIAVAFSGGGYLTLYKNDGFQNFSERQNYYANNIYNLDLKDIDGDGDLDIIAIYNGSYNSQKKIIVFENTDGDGTLNLIEISENFCRQKKVIDVDNDGDLDIVFSFDKLYWLENTGQYNFEIKQVLIDVEVSFFRLSDLNNDGDFDIIIGRNNSLRWFKSINGQIGFHPEQTIYNNLRYYSKTHAISINDIDNDGNLDIFIATNRSKLVWIKYDGNNNFDTEQIIFDTDFGFNLVESGDINNDGYIDVITSSYRSVKIVWSENLGNGNFVQKDPLSGGVDSPNKVLSVDIDNDGDLDIVSSSTSDGKIAWYENTDGNGNFSNQKHIAYFSHIDIFISDLNGDNYLDIIAVSSLNHEIIWYKNTGNGNFNSGIIIDNLNWPLTVFTMDVNNDNDQDIIIVNYSGMYLYTNDGIGNFTGPILIDDDIDADIGTKNGIASKDIDNDGDLDIILAVSYFHYSNSVKWYKNNGLGSFEINEITDNLPSVNSVIADDIDNDGDIDIMALSSNKLVWYENLDGLGSFSNYNQLSTFNHGGSNSLNFQDINNDGLKDIIYAHYNYQNDAMIFCKKNTSNGLFSSSIVVKDNLDDVKSLCVVDLDNDTDFDIVSATAFNNQISWYRNSQVSYLTDIKEKSNFSIFPNPTNNIISISTKERIINIKIYNKLGQLVLSNNNQNTINLSTLSNNVYFVKITTFNKTYSMYKVIKE